MEQGQEQEQEQEDILLELLNTEESYVSDFGLFHSVFVLPVLHSVKLGSGPTFPFGSQKLVKQFLNLCQEILIIHQTLLDHLRRIFQTSTSPSPDIGQLFQDTLPPIRFYYAQYAQLYRTMVHTMKKYMRPYPYTNNNNSTPFAEFVRECSAKFGGRAVSSYLILPVQRLPRYLLLFRSLNGNSSNNGNSTMDECIQSMAKCVEYVDAGMRSSGKDNNDKDKDSDKKETIGLGASLSSIGEFIPFDFEVFGNVLDRIAGRSPSK